MVVNYFMVKDIKTYIDLQKPIKLSCLNNLKITKHKSQIISKFQYIKLQMVSSCL